MQKFFWPHPPHIHLSSKRSYRPGLSGSHIRQKRWYIFLPDVLPAAAPWLLRKYLCNMHRLQNFLPARSDCSPPGLHTGCHSCPSPQWNAQKKPERFSESTARLLYNLVQILINLLPAHNLLSRHGYLPSSFEIPAFQNLPRNNRHQYRCQITVNPHGSEHKPEAGHAGCWYCCFLSFYCRQCQHRLWKDADTAQYHKYFSYSFASLLTFIRWQEALLGELCR